MTVSTAPSTPTISTTGQGRREVQPDLVELHFVLEGVFPTVREAEVQLQRRRTTLLSALDKHRSRETHLTANEPVIAPQRDYEHHAYVFKGYKATDHLVLRAPFEPYFVSNVLQSVASQIEHLAFTVRFKSKSTGAALRSARAEAVRDARRKASHFAKAADHQLGRLLRLSDSPPPVSDDGRDHGMIFEAMPAAPTDVDPESLAITAGVYAMWELIPA